MSSSRIAVDPEPLSIGVDGSGKRWPGGVIPYTIHPGLPQQQRVTDAIAHWEAKTSIDFVPRTNQDDYVEFTNGTWCHADVGRKGGKQHVWLATSKSDEAIRGMAIASNDWVYTWYADGMVSAGTSTDLDNRRTQYPYRLPPGYQPDDIVEIAIAGNDRVYTWYTDRKVSVGTTDDLDAHTDRVYTFYVDGKVSVGTTADLDAHVAPYDFELPGNRTASQILAVGISADDTVYAWYTDGKVSSGTSNDLGAARHPADLEESAERRRRRRGRGDVLRPPAAAIRRPRSRWRCRRRRAPGSSRRSPTACRRSSRRHRRPSRSPSRGRPPPARGPPRPRSRRRPGRRGTRPWSAAHRRACSCRPPGRRR